MVSPDAAPIEPLLRDQWAALRAWIVAEGVLDRPRSPRAWGAWTVGDLVVHLGHGLWMIAEVGSAGGQEPISLAEYVSGYAPARDQIVDDTATVAASWRGRELAGIDALAAEAWTALDAGLPTVVLGRRGPLRRDDFLLTRLLEVVTHGDDLHRLLRVHRPAPLLPIAVDRVAAVLTAGYRQRTDRQPPWTGIELIRVATGRTVTGDPVMPLLS